MELTNQLKESVAGWREKYGKVFGTAIAVGAGSENKLFVWRRIAITEYKKVSSKATNHDLSLEAEEDVCGLCVLYPGDFDFLTCEASIPTQLAVLILTSSGYGQASTELLEKYRAAMNSFEKQLPLVICEGLNGYDEHKVARLSMDEALEKFAEAEWVLATLRGRQLTQGGQEGMVPAKNPMKFMQNMVGQGNLPDEEFVRKQKKIDTIRSAMAQNMMNNR